MRNKLLVFVLFIFSLGNINFAQTAFYVDDDFTSSISGWGVTNFSTIQSAISSASNGYIINVAAGTYNENIVVNKAVQIIGAGASTTIIVATTANNTPLVFSTTGATVSGFTLTHSYTSGELSAWTFNNNGVSFTGGGGNTLSNCIVSLNRNGIYLNAAQSNNTISNNTITNNRTGINMTGVLNGTTITGNIISDNWTIGIVTYANTNVTNYSSVVISGNIFTNNWYSEILVKDVTNCNGILNVTNNTFNDSPVTFSNSADVSLNEPGFASQKPTELGGSATKPNPDLPTLRIYNNGSVSLQYNSTKNILVRADQSIQAAITAANNNDVIQIADGTYNEVLNVTKANLTIKGNTTAPANVVINAGGLTGYGSPLAGIFVNQPGVVLQGFTLIGGGQATTTTPRYGIGISGVTGGSIQNVVVQNFSRSGINATLTSGFTFDQITAINNGGNGIGLRDVSNSTISNVTTNNNLWGGVRVQTYDGPVSGMVISGTNNFGENGTAPLYLHPLLIEQGNSVVTGPPIPITYGFSGTPNLLLQSADFNYTLTGDDDEAPQYQRIHGYKIKENAVTASEAPIGTYAFHLTNNRVIREIATGELVVPPSLEIADAILAADDGDVINIEPGSYPAFVINKPITLTGSNGAIINHGSPAITVNSTGVTITGFTFDYNASDFAIDVQPGAYDVVVNQCRFLNMDGVNVGNGIRNQGTGTVTAVNNYWNSYTGPTIASNPGGIGSVAANISTGTLTYSPWLLYNGPDLTYPANLATSISVTPNFQWSWPWGGSTPTYTIEIATDAAFSSVVYGPVAATSPHSLPALNALNPLTTYYYRILANDAGNLTTSSAQFTTTTPPPGLIAPANNATGVSSTPTLSWTAIAGANLYRITITGSGAPAAFTTTLTSATLASPLVIGAVYSWYVESSENSGVTWSSHSTVWNFTTDFVITPADLATGVSVVPAFDWEDVPAAASYTLQIATDIAFSSVVLTKPVVSSNYTLLSSEALTNGVTYYWRVSSNNGVVSGTRRFIVVQQALPYLTIPGNGSTLIGDVIYFAWYVIGTTATNFDLEIDDANDFLTPVQTFSGLTNSYYNWTYTGLATGSTYYWRVISRTSGGVIVNYSPTWNFVVPGMPDVFASYPTGGVTVYTTSPALYWYTGTYYNGQYQIRYGTSSGIYNAPITTSNLYETLSGLTTGSTIYWQVRSYQNPTTFGNWSAEQSFTINGSTATPVVPYLSYPTGGSVVYTNPPTLYWYIGAYAPGLQYEVRYATSSSVDGSGMLNDGSALNFGSLTTNLYATFGSSLSAGTYYWQIRSYNGVTYSAWSAIESFVINSIDNSISTPIATTPTGGVTIYTINPTLYYYAYSNAALEYRVNYSAWPNTDVNGVLNLDNTASLWTANTNYDLSGLTPGVTYYWQVQARLVSTPATISSWSTVASFTTAAGAFAVVPQIGSPNYGQAINNTSAVLSWVIPTPSSSPLKYELQYSEKPDMSNVQVVGSLSNPYYQVSGLNKNRTYYWRVASKNNNGSSSYSPIGSFKTASTTAVENEQLPTEFELDQNYPNPFNPTTLIQYALPANSFVSLKIYDVLGKEVKTLVNSEVVAGKHSIEWRGDDNSGNKVATGVYVYRIKTNSSSKGTGENFVSSKKMLLIK